MKKIPKIKSKIIFDLRWYRKLMQVLLYFKIRAGEFFNNSCSLMVSHIFYR